MKKARCQCLRRVHYIDHNEAGHTARHVVEGVRGYLGFLGCNTAGMESIPEKCLWFSWCVREPAKATACQGQGFVKLTEGRSWTWGQKLVDHDCFE